MKNMKKIVIHGGNPATPHLAQRAGWRYGARGDYTLYAQPYMLDLDWTAGPGAWPRHLALLAAWQPVQSVVMDLECPSQIEEMTKRYHQALPHTRPVIVPKYRGAAWAIRCHCPHAVIGVSVPTAYAGFLPRALEGVAGADIHLLGGHPDQWAYLVRYYRRSCIVSLDGNAAIVQAMQYGKLWSRYGGYRELRGRGFATSAIVIASLRNAARYLASGRQPNPASKRIQACKAALDIVPRQHALLEATS